MMNRRHFLKISSLTLASALFPSALWASTVVGPKSASATVWELHGSPTNMIADLFDAVGGLPSLLNTEAARATVLIKPNFCLPHPPEMGTTTSPEVISALCDYLTDAGVKKIIVADHTLKGSARKFQNTEMVQVLSKFPRVKWVFANQQRFYTPLTVNGKVLPQTEILKLYRRANLTINLATAKHHAATDVSLAVKNLMGLIWERSSFHVQLDLAQAIADLATAIRPQFHIVDATRVLLTGGPTGPGTVIRENRLFASTDPVAVDAVVVSRYNFGSRQLSAKDVAHLNAAFQNGVGEIDLQRIDVKTI